MEDSTIDSLLLSGEGGVEGGVEGGGGDEFVRGLFESLLLTTRASNALPGGDDFDYANTYTAFREAASGARGDVLDLLGEVLGHVGLSDSSAFGGGGGGGGAVEEGEIFEAVVDAVDALLEEVDLHLNGLRGAGGEQQASQMAQHLSRSSNIPKPQEKFATTPDNSRPKEGSVLVYSAPGRVSHEEHLALLEELSYMEWQLSPPEEPPHLPEAVPDPPHAVPAEIEAKFVSTEEELHALVRGLQGAREICIDLEHHSFRSFQGFTCLMQITANDKDWLVDTLSLRHVLGAALGTPFLNPSIVKVLHGCDSDVVWMQRDFGLYLVNVFDTGRASRYLGLQSFGYAHLLSKYCNISVSKAHQLSDWRLRPISDSMARYAQRDTRYLPYLHATLRRELHQRGGREAIMEVLDASRELCRKRYERPRFDALGWRVGVERQRMRDGTPLLKGPSVKVVEKLWDWRDVVAREEDESVSYVMSMQLLLRIGQQLPRSMDALNLCGRPLPPLVQARARSLLSLIATTLSHQDEERDISDDVHTPGKFPSGAIRNNNVTFTPVAAEPYFRSFSVTPSHASEFVTQAMRSAADGSGRKNGGSALKGDQPTPPVLDTEELYRAAGWTTPTPGQYPSKLRLAPDNAGEVSSVPMQNSLLLQGKNKDENQQQHAAKGRAQAQMIRDEIAREPVMSFRNVKGFMKGIDDAEASGITTEEVDPDAGTEVEMDGEVEGIPKSMADIYKISNRNRRRNKEKKRIQDAPQMDNSPEGSGAVGADSMSKLEDRAMSPSDRMVEYFSGRKRQKADSKVLEAKGADEDTLDFIEGIAWISPESREAIVTEMRSQQNPAPVQPSRVPQASEVPAKGARSISAANRESRNISGRRARGSRDSTVDYASVPSAMGANPFVSQQGNSHHPGRAGGGRAAR